MPIINFRYDDLCKMIGKDVPMNTLIEKIPMIGADMHDTEGKHNNMSIEFFPNRPDMYSVEGIARSLQAFLGIKTGMKKYNTCDSNVCVIVDDSIGSVRPYILCGLVMNIKVDDNVMLSMMELQEKLHITIGRRRSKVAIGIHDFDRLKPPFIYKLVDPHSVRFIPLSKNEEMDLEEILHKHEKGIQYAYLVNKYTKYPIIEDSNGSVVSFPPIINGALTSVTTGKHNLFIEVTGNDLRAVKGALNIICCALQDRGGDIMTVNVNNKNDTFRSPDLKPIQMNISSSECDKFLGTNLGPDGVIRCLCRMGMDATAIDDIIHVMIPPMRLDIMHEVDIFEDIAIGYGFDKFGGTYSLDQTVGGLKSITTFSENIRDIMIGLGFIEVTTLTLSNNKFEFDMSKLPIIDNVRILNPISKDHTCLRSYLSPSLIKILEHNTHRDLPQKIFEVGYVIEGCMSVLHLCAMVAASKTSFTDIKSVTESILREMECEYKFIPCNIQTFINGRGASIISDNKNIGMFGEMSPYVISSYGITHPVMFLEINLEHIISSKKDTIF